MTIYLYVKTHRKTGLKYLGKTNSQDPYKYKGSGIYWTRHLKEHGLDVETAILHECKTNEEVRELGKYYSNLWDVVNAVDDQGRKIWANLKPEEGDGGWGGEQNPNNLPHIKKNKSDRFKINNPIHQPGIKEKSRENTKKAMKDPEIRKRFLDGINSESWRTSRAARVGNKAPCFDHTIYTFVHKDGRTIQCTQYELNVKFNANGNKLVNGKQKTSGGWKLVR
jgi:hypothetical protein